MSDEQPITQLSSAV